MTMGTLFGRVCLPGTADTVTSVRGEWEYREQQAGSGQSWRSVCTWRRPWLWNADQNVSNALTGRRDQGAGTKICCPTGTRGDRMTTTLSVVIQQTLSQTDG